jgi:flagellar export protein FliJ
MKTFKFRFRAVLVLREQVEREAQQRYARAIAVVNGAAGRLAAAEGALASADQARELRLAAGAPAGELEQARQYSVLLTERRNRFTRELNDARQRAETARQQLAAASQRCEALERLRGHQQRRHAYAAARAEQKILDELTGRTHALAQTLAQNHAGL